MVVIRISITNIVGSTLLRIPSFWFSTCYFTQLSLQSFNNFANLVKILPVYSISGYVVFKIRTYKKVRNHYSYTLHSYMMVSHKLYV
jgi:hypothetical protein